MNVARTSIRLGLILSALFVLATSCAQEPTSPTSLAPLVQTVTARTPGQPLPIPTPTIVLRLPTPVIVPSPVLPTSLVTPTPTIVLRLSTPVVVPSPVPHPASPTATMTLRPPSPVPPTPNAQAVMSEVEYAKACGALMTVDMEGMSNEDFSDWVQSIGGLNPPESLVDYHFGMLSLYGGMLDLDRADIDVKPPYIRQIKAIVALDYGVGQLLSDELCLRRTQVEVSRAIAVTRGKLANMTPQSEPMTVEEYAIHCADIILASPWGDSIEAMASHIYQEWSKIVPPPEMRVYHDALLAFYEEFVRTGLMDIGSPAGQIVIAAVSDPLPASNGGTCQVWMRRELESVSLSSSWGGDFTHRV